jgi:hypothetical protein
MSPKDVVARLGRHASRWYRSLMRLLIRLRAPLRSHPHTILPVRPRAVVATATVARQQTAGTEQG